MPDLATDKMDPTTDKMYRQACYLKPGQTFRRLHENVRFLALNREFFGYIDSRKDKGQMIGASECGNIIELKHTDVVILLENNQFHPGESLK